MEGGLIKELPSRGAAPAAAGVVSARVPISDTVVKTAAGNQVILRRAGVNQRKIVEKILAGLLDIDIDPAAGGRSGNADRAPLVASTGSLAVHSSRIRPAGGVVRDRVGYDLLEAVAQTIGADIPVLALPVAGGVDQGSGGIDQGDSLAVIRKLSFPVTDRIADAVPIAGGRLVPADDEIAAGQKNRTLREAEIDALGKAIPLQVDRSRRRIGQLDILPQIVGVVVSSVVHDLVDGDRRRRSRRRRALDGGVHRHGGRRDISPAAPVPGIVSLKQSAEPLQRAAGAIGPGLPGRVVIVAHGIDDRGGGIDQLDVLAAVVERRTGPKHEPAGHEPELGTEGERVPADHQETARLDRRAGLELVTNAAGEGPAREVDRQRAGIVELDEFEIGTLLRIVVNLVDDHAVAGRGLFDLVTGIAKTIAVPVALVGVFVIGTVVTGIADVVSICIRLPRVGIFRAVVLGGVDTIGIGIVDAILDGKTIRRTIGAIAAIGIRPHRRVRQVEYIANRENNVHRPRDAVAIAAGDHRRIEQLAIVKKEAAHAGPGEVHLAGMPGDLNRAGDIAGPPPDRPVLFIRAAVGAVGMDTFLGNIGPRAIGRRQPPALTSPMGCLKLDELIGGIAVVPIFGEIVIAVAPAVGSLFPGG